jgi:hypothetical protein
MWVTVLASHPSVSIDTLTTQRTCSPGSPRLPTVFTTSRSGSSPDSSRWESTRMVLGRSASALANSGSAPPATKSNTSLETLVSPQTTMKTGGVSPDPAAPDRQRSNACS